MGMTIRVESGISIINVSVFHTAREHLLTNNCWLVLQVALYRGVIVSCARCSKCFILLRREYFCLLHTLTLFISYCCCQSVSQLSLLFDIRYERTCLHSKDGKTESDRKQNHVCIIFKLPAVSGYNS